MANVLLAAMAQPTLGLQAPVERRRKPAPRANAGVWPAVASALRERPPHADAACGRALEMARAVAAAFDEIEALEVGAAVAARPGFRDGDVVLVDWSGGKSGTVRARRQASGVTLDVGDAASAGPGVVFAVVRRVDAA